ncbi:MAG: hypothetical protein QF404_04175 [Planctomycetota bacterium]|jgi:hypothetical protein|nr:hypothetical protein [Planctomycetota bacterium]
MKTAELTRNSSDNMKGRVVNLDREGIRRQWHPSAERVGTEDLTVTRQDIRFETVAPGRVLIEVTVRNRGDISSKPTQAFLRSAPLGAFLPWTPLTEVGVPSILPGGEHVVKVNAQYGSGNTGQEAALSLVRAWESRDLPRLVPSSVSGLRGEEIWLGNVYIHLRGAQGERHIAGRCRARAGVKNRACFHVGDGSSDQYDFNPLVRGTGLSTDWNIELTRLGGGDLSRPMCHGDVLLSFTPSGVDANATLEVHVTRRSTKKTAVVEFEVATR